MLDPAPVWRWFRMSSSLSISKIGPESDVLLRNLFEHYIHDMAEWFEIDTGADGRYAYDTSLLWETGCDAYLARAGSSMAGFAVVGSAVEWLGETGGHDMREFFVIRRFRRSGFGQTMATVLWNERPGEWLVRVLEANAPAAAFWRTVISSYARGAYEEEGRIVNGRPWRFFRFASNGAASPGAAVPGHSGRDA
jgi:predicted acetyltransferase